MKRLLSLASGSSGLFSLHLFALLNFSFFAQLAGATPLDAQKLFNEMESSQVHVLPVDECNYDQDILRSEEHEIQGAVLKQMAMDPANAMSAPAHGTGQQPTGKQGWFDWVPNGAPTQANRPECSAEGLEKTFLQMGSHPTEQAQAVQSFFNKCESHIGRFASSPALALAYLGTTKYNACQHSRLRKLRIQLDDGSIVGAFLGLKPTTAPRPLVIVKCGSFCDPGSASHRFQMMHLFDESPFHVLAVGNNTGSQFVRSNQFLSIGGFEEGMQAIRLAQLIDRSALRPYVSSIHFTGVSLGSHGGLYSTFFNEHNPITGGLRPLQSVLTICPVVDLKQTLNDLFDGSYKGKFASYYFYYQLAKVIRDVPVLQDLFPVDNMPPDNEIPDRIADGAVRRYKDLPDTWAMAPMLGTRILTRDDLWNINRFLDHTKRSQSTPTLIWNAEDDWIVNHDHNTKLLMEQVANEPGSVYKMVTVPRGNHCAMGIAYGWDISSAFYRGYVLSQSPEYIATRKPRNLEFSPADFSDQLQLRSDEQFFSQTWKVDAESDSITLTYFIYHAGQPQSYCSKNEPYQLESSCFRQVATKIPFSIFESEWITKPATEVEAEALTRWMNTNVRVTDTNGKTIHLTKLQPAFISWLED